jgi:hypothetical protein
MEKNVRGAPEVARELRRGNAREPVSVFTGEMQHGVPMAPRKKVTVTLAFTLYIAVPDWPRLQYQSLQI